MTISRPQAHPARAAGERPDDEALGDVVRDVAADASRLAREQLAIAKIELKRDAGHAGAGAGMFGGAAFAGYMVMMFGSLAAVYGLGHLIGNGWAALVVAGAWALLGLLLALVGRGQLRRIHGPQQTIASLKENMAWLRGLRK